MKIYLVRHGETDWNKMRRNQGQTDVPLNEKGIELARQTGEGLAGIPFDVCFTSPLKRAHQTGELILGEKDVPIIDDDRLMEISFGDYEGRCWDEENWDSAMSKEFLYFFNQPEKYKAPPGGESLDELEKRTGEFLEELCHRKKYENSTILVSTHGCALAACLNYIKKPERKDYWGGGVHRNCGVTEIEVRYGVPEILSENVIYYPENLDCWNK